MKALIIDDNISVVELISNALKIEGFKTDSALDGISAIQKLSKNNYDTIILDIMLPKLNGLDVIQTIRAGDQKTPILAISADNKISTRIEALTLGADDFLVKDFKYAELVARIKVLLRRIKNQTPTIIRAKHFSIDLASMSAFYKSKHVFLTKKEFQLYSTLMKNKNKVVSRADLQSEIQKSTEKQSNTLSVHIRSLRKKFKEGGDFIETVHGYGYIIKE